MSVGPRNPETAQNPVYIAYCRQCGGMTGAIADNPSLRKDVAEFAADFIEAGDYMERRTAADVWDGKWCECALTGQKSTGSPP